MVKVYWSGVAPSGGATFWTLPGFVVVRSSGGLRMNDLRVNSNRDTGVTINNAD